MKKYQLTEKLSTEAQNPAFLVGAVSGSINVTAGRNERYRQVHSNSKWFDNSEYFTIKDDGECLTIKKCGLEIPKNAQKFTSSRHFMYVSELPLGRFEFDIEESSEDILVIYYR